MERVENLTLKRASELLGKREVSSTELTKAFLKRIAETKRLNTLTYTAEKEALKAAAAADKIIKEEAGRTRPLLGVPVVMKDNVAVDGMPMTCGSKMLKDFYPPVDAGVVKRLKKEGAVILGKANMDEFAMGSSNETSAYGRVLNPVDESCVPGGSSGGSAASVAAGQCLGAYGTDTGGSVRQPAALCGIVGVKPTYGFVSRLGIIPFGSSLDQLGPLAKTVTDAAILLDGVAGHDAGDTTSLDIKYPDFKKIKPAALKGKKIGVIKEFLNLKVSDTVKEEFNRAVKFFESAGAQIIEESMPYADLAISLYGIISNAEAAANLAKYDGVKYGHRTASAAGAAELYEKTRAEGFGEEVKCRLLFGNYILLKENYEKYFVKACKIRTLIIERVNKIFARCDAVITPTSPTPAFHFGAKLTPTERRAADIFLTFTNMTGAPSVSVPCKNKGLPVALQIIADNGKDKEMLELALAYEEGI